MDLNLNNTTLLFFLIIILLFFVFPTGVVNIFLFAEVAFFGIYTLRRLNRKKWDNPAITQQERGRAIRIIVFYAAAYCCIMMYWLLINELDEFDNFFFLLTIMGCIQGIMLNYLIFQVNLELNYYGNTDHSGEGLITKIIKGRFYKQSNPIIGE
jgi:hypothetical protein